MHSKILCNRVRYCYPDQVQYINKSAITLKPGEHLKELFTETPAQYQHEKTHNEPGTQHTQTLDITIKHDSEIIALPNIPAIILLDTDAGPIVIGSILYPCEIQTTTDGKETHITCTSVQ
jgi:hypothetical protein